MFDLTTYVKKWRIRQLKTVFSTIDTLCSTVQLGESIVFGTFSAMVSLLNDMDDAHEVINNKQKVQNGCVC